MIVRSLSDHFICIKQHEHASISLQLLNQLTIKKRDFLQNIDSLKLAVRSHDCGWIRLDQSPKWNDETNAPYTFMDFPLRDKLQAYKGGIDQVVVKDAYAGLLCSHHYVQFSQTSDNQLAINFVKAERERQHDIINKMAHFNADNFNAHYDLLAFLDHLSLFICLYAKEKTANNQTPFIQAGVPMPQSFFLNEKKLAYDWLSENDLTIKNISFKRNFSIHWREKKLLHKDVEMNGLEQTYKHTPYTDARVHITYAR
ncbi:MAG TPA: DUF3891 family protein [Bacillota bacterium]|nr:DUF3891 family protein [Bacillota bacterium]